MQNTVDTILLQFALKSKNFIAELASKTKDNYYTRDTRTPIKLLFDYFNQYKDIPSYERLCEFAELTPDAYPHLDQTKQVLDNAFKADKATLTDGDFPFLIDKLKKQYNDAYLKNRIDVLSKHLSGTYNVDEANDYIKKTYFEINSLTSTEVYAQGTLQDSAKERWNRYKEIKQNPELARGILSGFKGLDTITNGFKGSELILVSGPTGSGKSVVMMNMAVNAWLGKNRINMPEQEWDNSGHNIWFISIENPKGMMERRIDSCVAGVSCDHLRDGTWDEEEGRLVKQALAFQYQYDKKFYISDLGRGVTMATVEAQYEKLLSIFEPDMIVIDYLGIMKASNPTGSDWFEQGTNAADMHEFCRIINKPILTASQMKSALRTQAGLKRFTGDPESVARSKMITDNVNMNLQIKKDEDFNMSSYMELCVAKNRDGKTGDVIHLTKEFWRQRVCDTDADLLVSPTLGEEEDE